MTVYTIDWLDPEQSIILIELTGTAWSWVDAYEAMVRQQQLMQEVTHEVDTILDFSAAPGIPQLGALPNFKKLMQMRAANERLLLFVGTPLIFQTIVDIVEKVYKITDGSRKVYFLRHRDEALNILKQQARPQP